MVSAIWSPAAAQQKLQAAVQRHPRRDELIEAAIRLYDAKSTISVKELHGILTKFKAKMSAQETQGVFDAAGGGYGLGIFEMLCTLLPREQAKRKWSEYSGQQEKVYTFDRGQSRENQNGTSVSQQMTAPMAQAAYSQRSKARLTTRTRSTRASRRSKSAASMLPTQALREQNAALKAELSRLTPKPTARSNAGSVASIASHSMPKLLGHTFIAGNADPEDLPQVQTKAQARQYVFIGGVGMYKNGIVAPSDSSRHASRSGARPTPGPGGPAPKPKIDFGIQWIREKNFGPPQPRQQPPKYATSLSLWDSGPAKRDSPQKRPASVEGPPAQLHPLTGRSVSSERKEFWHEWHWRNERAGRLMTKADKRPGGALKVGHGELFAWPPDIMPI